MSLIRSGLQLLNGLLVPRRGRPGDAPPNGAWLYLDARTDLLRYRTATADRAVSSTSGGMTPVSSAVDPGVNDDVGDGYAIGQLWVNNSTGAAFILTDATAGAAVWRSVLSGARRLRIDVSGGTLGWSEELWTSAGWVAVTGRTALTTQTDGGITFSGTTMTLPSGWTTQTTPHLQHDLRYLALSSTSSTFQALLATAAVLALDATETSMGTTSNSRWGCALAATGGTDWNASSETIIAHRHGYTGATYTSGYAFATGTLSGLGSGSAGTTRRGVVCQGVARGFFRYSASDAAGTPPTSAPDRLYVTGSASGAVSSTTAVGSPVVLLTALPLP